jgi:hypothetical protein
MFEVLAFIFNCGNVVARYGILITWALMESASSQFSPGLLQNKSYWGDGKSEVDLYGAEFMRDGQRYPCDLTMIFTPKFVDPLSLADSSMERGAVPAIEMHEFATVPRGLMAEQRSIRALWRMDFMSLAHISCAGADGLGQVVRSIDELRDKDKAIWQYRSDTYRERVNLQDLDTAKGLPFSYDELPLRIRTIDFSKQNGAFEVQLLPSLLATQEKLGDFSPAKISWKTGERTIDIDVQHGGGKDHFVLDANFPFLLREWNAADGSRFKMKNSLKVAYRNYMKPGDRERALKDPMLRHPD